MSSSAAAILFTVCELVCLIYFFFISHFESAAAEFAAGLNIIEHMDHIVNPAVTLFPRKFQMYRTCDTSVVYCKH